VKRDLWVKCPCRRNLATIIWPDIQRSSRTEPDGMALRVKARPGVTMSTYQPDPSDPMSATYTWECHCGKSHTRRHAWVHRAWRATAGTGKVLKHRRVVDVTDSYDA
jgi:hypothetical protein